MRASNFYDNMTARTNQIWLIAIVLVFATQLGACRKAEDKKLLILARANQFFRDNDYEKAKIEYLNVLRLDRTELTALQRVGTIWLEQGAPLEAYPYFSQAHEFAPDDSTIEGKLIEILVDLGETEAARARAIAILKDSPAAEEAILAVARTACNQKEFDEVREQLRKIPEGNDLLYHLAAARLAISENDLAYAESELDQAGLLKPSSIRVHLDHAEVAVLRNDRAKAAKEFQTACDLSPVRSTARLKYAEFFNAVGEAEKAIELLEQTTQQAPDFLPAWCLLADIRLSQKQVDQAALLVENVLSRDPQNLNALLLQAEVWIGKGETKQAVDLLEGLSSTYPAVPLVSYQLARGYFAQNNLVQAAGALNDALTVKPDYTQAILLQAKIQLKEGKPALVIPAMVTLIQRTPTLTIARKLLAQAYSDSERLQDAAETLAAGLNLSAGWIDGYIELGNVLRRQQKGTAARAAFSRVLELDPENTEALEALVDADLEKNDPTSAMARVAQKLEKKPDSAEAYLLRGKIYRAQHDWTQAEANLHKALELAPSFFAPLHLLVSIYSETDRSVQAISELRTFLTKNPSHIDALTDLGLVYDRTQDYAKAREIYQQILSIVPESVGALNNLAYIFAEHLDEPEEAIELAARARALQPLNPAIADTLGLALYRNADYRQAQTVLRDAAAKLTNNADVQFHFGLASYIMGDSSSAETAFQAALDAGRQEPEAVRCLKFLRDARSLTSEQLEEESRQHPDDVMIWNQLGEYLHQRGVFSKSAAAYERALQINPEFAPAAIKLAELNLGPLQDAAAAFDFAKRARDLLPADASVAGLLARAVMRIGNTAWAYSLAQEAARRLSNDPRAIHDLGWSAYSMGKMDQARGLMQTVGRLNPDPAVASDATIFLQMTSTAVSDVEIDKVLAKEPAYIPALMAKAEHRSDPTSAISLYQEVLDHWPEFPIAQKFLAALYAEEPGKLDAAFDLALKARNSLIDDPELAQTLGVISYRRNDFSYAVQCFQETARKRPLRPRELYYLGIAQLRLSKDQESRKALETAIRAGLPEPMMEEAKAVVADLRRRTSEN
jgi:tetratricopeptide (TPR) repeat protein